MTSAEQWFSGAALLGVLAASWTRIKLLSWRIFNLLIARARLDGYAEHALCYYLWTEAKRTPFGEKRISGVSEFVQPLDRYQMIGFEKIGRDPQIFWLGWKPIVVSNNVQALDGGGNTSFELDVSFIRGTFDLDELVIKAFDVFNNLHHHGNKRGRYSVRRSFGKGALRTVSYRAEGQSSYKNDSPSLAENDCSTKEIASRRYLKWDRSQLGMPRGDSDPFACLAYPPCVLQVVERCRRWLASEEWYKEKEIPWRFGVLTHGKPGTGKTSFVKAVGKLLNLPITSYDLASYGNQDFEGAWQSMMSDVPCIALLEDIDAVFNGRKNRLGEEGGGLTFDCLLNCIGGIKEANGVLIFVTTNHPECLDDALGRPDGDLGVSTRPGRIDVAVELGLVDKECRYRIAKRILEDCPDRIDEVVSGGEGLSPAQFVEICSEIALEYYWSDKSPKDKREANGALTMTYVNSESERKEKQKECKTLLTEMFDGSPYSANSYNGKG